MKNLIGILLIILVAPFADVFGQGKLWGLTTEGGNSGAGVIYNTDADGSNYTVKYEFEIVNPGKSPGNKLTLRNGKLYGVASEGGSFDKGVLFEFDPSNGNYSVLKNFDGDASGGTPGGGVMLASNGKFYGLTFVGGANDVGVLYEFDPVGNIFTKKHDFFGADDGGLPGGMLMEASNGKFYGLTSQFGGTGNGTLFEYDPVSEILTKKIDLDFTTGGFAMGNLVEVSSKLYGTAPFGGGDFGGTLFEYDLNTELLDVKHDFDFLGGGTTGGFPTGSLTLASNGKLYGVATVGGQSVGGVDPAGVLFEFDPAGGSYAVKVQFNIGNIGGDPKGGAPSSTLLLGSDNLLYGMNTEGGASGGGVLFVYNPVTPNFSVLHDIGISDRSIGTLTELNGQLFGIANSGGSTENGSIFRYNLSGDTYTTILSFNLSPDGDGPECKFTLVNDKFYATTTGGGSFGYGVIFEFDPVSLAFTKKYEFDDTQGRQPFGKLELAPNGKLYGFTGEGGDFDNGVFYEFDPATSNVVKIHDYGFGSAFGEGPYNMAVGDNGKIYGTTKGGGTNDNGVLFEYDPSTGNDVVKINFEESTNGSEPGHLVKGGNGKLYGATESGGANGDGILFEFDPGTGFLTKKLDLLVSTGSGDDVIMTRGPGNKLYGVAGGGANDSGVVFEYDYVLNSYSDRYDLDNKPHPVDLTISSNGKMYVTSEEGGEAENQNEGLLFEFDFVSGTYAEKRVFEGSTGIYPVGIFFHSTIQDQTITFAALPNKTLGDAPFNLTATASSELPVSFTTSTVEKLTINGKLVTLTSAGKASITAKQVGNDQFNPAPDVAREFCINPAQPAITVSSVNTESPVLTSSSATGNQWFKDGAAIADATNNSLTVLSPGVYAVQVTIETCVSALSNDLPLIITGLEFGGAAFSLSPNPARDKLHVKLPNLSRKKVIGITGLDGRLMMQMSTERNEEEVVISSYPAGLYILEVQAGNSVLIKKFIKQ